LKKFALIFSVLLFIGCTPAPVRSLEAKYPRCKVEKVNSSHSSIEIKVKCPGEAPFKETFFIK